MTRTAPRWPRSFVFLLAAPLLAACGSERHQDANDAEPLHADAAVADLPVATPDAIAPAVDVAAVDLPTEATCPQGASFDDAIRKIVVVATVDGKGPFSLFYDTGAPQTLLTPAVTGKVANTVSTVQSIDLGGGVKLGPVNAVTYPMPPSIGLDGIIGNDAFAGRVVSIDYGRKRLWVDDDELDQAALAACGHLSPTEPTVLPLHIDSQTGFLMVEGSLDGVEGDLLVDTGASLGGVPQWVLDESTVDHPAVHGYWLSAFIGHFWSSLTLIGEITIGPHTVERLVMYSMPNEAVPSGDSDKMLGTLPYSFMQHFVVSIDFAGETLQLAPIEGQDLVGDFALNGYGLSLSVDTEGPVAVTDVIAGSPAAKAGIQPDDVVLDVAGIDPAEVPADERIGLVLTSAPGEPRAFTVDRAGQQQTHSLVSTDVFAGVP